MIKVWSAESGEELQTITAHGDAISSVAIAAAGERLVTGSWDKTLIIHDAETGEKIRTLRGHEEAVTCVALTPDGSRIVSGSGDKSLIVWIWNQANCYTR